MKIWILPRKTDTRSPGKSFFHSSFLDGLHISSGFHWFRSCQRLSLAKFRFVPRERRFLFLAVSYFYFWPLVIFAHLMSRPVFWPLVIFAHLMSRPVTFLDLGWGPQPPSPPQPNNKSMLIFTATRC